MADVKPRPPYQNIDGILFPPFPPQCIREALDYKAMPGDVFVATYPKCGTTWMQNVVIHLLRKGKALDDPKDFIRISPFIDFQGKKAIDEMIRPGALKTHLPYSHVPYSPDAKYIYVLRNPKDTCVSLYYHTKRLMLKDATFDDFFEIFIAGEVEYNDYFDHLMSWYPHLKDKQVFFATYEDMKKDLKAVVLRLAAFLGEEYVDAIEKDSSVLDNILHFSSFEFMKKNLLQRFPIPEGEDAQRPKDDSRDAAEKGKMEHLRKGIVGDWRNHFSEEQSERLNKKFEERTKGTEIYEMYKSYMGL